MKKEILIGFIVALIATTVGCYIFIEFFSKNDFEKTLHLLIKDNLVGKVVAMGAILNFFPFFVFLKKKQIYRARGVLLESILIALLVLFTTLFFW